MYTRRTNLLLGLFCAMALAFAACTNQSQQKETEENTSQHPAHPYLYWNPQAIQFWKELPADHPYRPLKGHLRKVADAFVLKPELVDTLDRRQTILAHVSREAIRRITTLTVAYRIFDDQTYLEAAKANLLRCAGFRRWNTHHTLDVAEMSVAVGCGYDWLYQELSEEERKTIREALLQKSARPYLDSALSDTPPYWAWWVEGKNNWNFVCNTGFMVGAMAISETYPKLKDSIRAAAVPNMKALMVEEFPPDGMWYEGGGYWGYSNIYLTLGIDALDSVYGHDFGMSSIEGYPVTAKNFLKSTTPTYKIFNFFDCGKYEPRSNAILLWHGQKFNEPKVLAYQVRQLLEEAKAGSEDVSRLFAFNFFWMPRENIDLEADFEDKTGLYRSKSPFVVLEDGDFSLLMKGGKGNLNHGQYDMGTLMLESDSMLFIEDMGSEHYHLPDFWGREKGGGRWQYWRNTNLLHSTLVLNNQPMDYVANGIFIKEPKGNNKSATLDMSTCYADLAGGWHRSAVVLAEGKALLKDSLWAPKKEVPIRWQFVTTAKGTVAGNTLTLKQKGRTMHFRILKPKGAQWKTYPKQGPHPEEKDNSKYTLWGFEVPFDASSKVLELELTEAL